MKNILCLVGVCVINMSCGAMEQKDLLKPQAVQEVVKSIDSELRKAITFLTFPRHLATVQDWEEITIAQRGGTIAVTNRAKEGYLFEKQSVDCNKLVVEVAARCCATAHALTLSSLTDLSADTVEKALCMAPNLQNIRLIDCPSLDYGLLEDLRKRYPKAAIEWEFE